MIGVFYSSSNVIPISVISALNIIIAFSGAEGGTSGPRNSNGGGSCSVQDQYQQLQMTVSYLLLVTEIEA